MVDMYVAADLTKRQRRLTYAVIFLLSLLGGVEYAVILPTLYLHLENTYHAPTYALGIVLSAFSFSGLFASPIMGRIYDTTRRAKLLITLTNLFNVVGSLMYWMGLNVWFLTASRLVAGLGNGFFSIILAEVTHASTAKNRTALVSAIMAARQIGLLVGPGCTLFLQKTDFYIGEFVVNVYSSPGLFMAVLWLVASIIHIIFYYPLTKKISADDLTVISNPLPNDSTKQTDNNHQHKTFTTLAALKALVYDEYMAIFMLTFVALFNQTGAETLITPLCTNYLGWNEIDISFLFFGCGVLILVSFALVNVLSKRFEDRPMIIFGMMCQVVSIAWLFWVPSLDQNPESYTKNTVILVSGVAVVVFGLPFLFVCHVSLFSKLLHKNIQGTGHGVRRTVGGLASILGPLWCSSLFHLPQYMISVMVGLNIIALDFLFVNLGVLQVLMGLSYKRLKPTETDAEEENVSSYPSELDAASANEEVNERSLLVNT